MSNRMHALAQHLTGKETIDDCSIEEVRHIAQRHPYFAPAQFLLLQKLRQAGAAEEAEAQYRKAVLFFHDPLLFEHFISSNKFYLDEIAPSTITEPEQEYEKETEQEDFLVDNGTDGSNLTEEVIDVPETVSTAFAEPIVEEEQKPIETFVQPEAEPAANMEASSLVSEPEITIEKEPTFSEGKAIENASASAPASTLENNESTKTDLAFEPFHTVDYFASQGIKISQEEIPKDKLGKQLKSFTEWLKTMKRLPASQITETAESSAEKKVESMASHSVSESDVVTEAMAEVWMKQGNTEKALDIYNKLSLQNPSKKAYFAAKIENLKLS